MNPHSKLRIALVSDDLTRSCLKLSCKVRNVTPYDGTLVLKYWKPDFLFVESAWHGLLESWEYKIASFPSHPRRNNNALRALVSRAKDLGIPTVFWNKEDSVHFNRFIDSAALFDHVFTVDENAIPAYKARMGQDASVHSLMFAIHPALHHPSSAGYRFRRACFPGSYSRHVHDRRRLWQDMLFTAAEPLGVTVFDRNSGRKAGRYRYPDMPWLEVRKAVAHKKTPQIYRDHMVCLNVNTIEDSATMFSRRLVEILGCGSIAVTTPSQAVARLFGDFCHAVSSPEEAGALFARLAKDGPSARDLDRARAGAAEVLARHTWDQRLSDVLNVIKNK